MLADYFHFSGSLVGLTLEESTWLRAAFDVLNGKRSSPEVESSVDEAFGPRPRRGKRGVAAYAHEENGVHRLDVGSDGGTDPLAFGRLVHAFFRRFPGTEPREFAFFYATGKWTEGRTVFGGGFVLVTQYGVTAATTSALEERVRAAAKR